DSFPLHSLSPQLFEEGQFLVTQRGQFSTARDSHSIRYRVAVTRVKVPGTKKAQAPSGCANHVQVFQP
ncbi:hypothetical protein, partial [Bradyrhizobium sp. RT5a]|uniref:hypothetical protein n=1 Tax=unclassified Bradyrhizobium TaxID=2631580 RepID=UPI0033935B60